VARYRPRAAAANPLSPASAHIGPYVADFAFLRAKVLIELDGPSHAQDGAQHRDARRTAWLQSEGYRVLRFWHEEVFDNLDGVLDTIYAALYGSLDADLGFTPPRSASPPAPPPRGEGEER
jgi:hypothetical protein